MNIQTLSRWFATFCATALASCAALAEQTNAPARTATSSPDELRRAAEETYFAYNAAIQAGNEPRASGDQLPEIHSQYWTDPIKALHPVKVYLHHWNLAVVQKVSGDVEEGIYIGNSISSYAGISTNNGGTVKGTDGFSFSRNREDGTLNFRKPKTP